MNIELHDMSRLTILAKAFLKNGAYPASLTKSADVGKRLFRFSPEYDGGDAYEVCSCEEWLDELSRRGATDFKLIVPQEIDGFDRLGRANGLPCCIICFYGGRATAWNRLWSYDGAMGKWYAQLIEFRIAKAHEKPVLSDPTEDMINLLGRIRELSRRLHLSEFSFRFSAALKALQTDLPHASTLAPLNYRLFRAATEAYVFGGRGSWTDTARIAASDKGLSDEYGFLTGELYKGIALCLMYAVNEW